MSSQITDGVCGSSTLPHVNEKSSNQTELSEEPIPSSPEFTVKDRMNVVTAEWEGPICQHLSLGLFCSGSRTKPHMQQCWTEQDRKKATGWTSILYSSSLLIRHFSSYWSSAGLDAETNRVCYLSLCCTCVVSVNNTRAAIGSVLWLLSGKFLQENLMSHWGLQNPVHAFTGAENSWW